MNLPADIVKDFDRRVSRSLGRLGQRIRLYSLVGGAAKFVAALVVIAAAQFALDWLLRLETAERAVLLTAAAAGVLVCGWRWLIRPLTAPVDTESLAILVEGRFTHLRDRLISALQFARGQVADAAGASTAMMKQVLHQAAHAMETLPLLTLLDRRRAAGAGGLLIVFFAGIGALCWTRPEPLQTWFLRNVLLADVAWRQDTYLTLEGFTDRRLRHPRGDDLTIVAEARGVVPEQVRLHYRFASGRRGREVMTRVGDRRFRFQFPAPTETIRVRLTGGDERTAWHTVEMVDRPRVIRAQIRVEPPAYCGIEPYELREGQTVIEVLPGSTIRLSLEANKPVRSAQPMWANRADRGPIDIKGRPTWNDTLRPTVGGSFHYRLVGADGLENRQPVRFNLRLITDRSPLVRLNLFGVGEMITPQAVLPVEMSFQDRYGLASAELAVTSEGSRQIASTMPVEALEPGATQLASQVDLPVEPMGLAPQDRLLLQARARDGDDVTVPKKPGESPLYQLRVVSREDLLAELARREQEFRQEFERLLRDQEGLRGTLASWAAAVSRGSPGSAQLQQLSAAHRRQRQHIRQVLQIREQFEQILAELRVNRLETPLARRRLGQGVVTPMQSLARPDMADAAEMLEKLDKRLRSRAGDDEDLAAELGRIDPLQQAIVEKMNLILANMLKWEGYQEAVALLRDILQGQRGVSEDTRRALEERIRRLFEDEPATQPSKP